MTVFLFLDYLTQLNVFQAHLCYMRGLHSFTAVYIGLISCIHPSVDTKDIVTSFESKYFGNLSQVI